MGLDCAHNKTLPSRRWGGAESIAGAPPPRARPDWLRLPPAPAAPRERAAWCACESRRRSPPLLRKIDYPPVPQTPPSSQSPQASNEPPGRRGQELAQCSTLPLNPGWGARRAMMSGASAGGERAVMHGAASTPSPPPPQHTHQACLPRSVTSACACAGREGGATGVGECKRLGLPPGTRSCDAPQYDGVCVRARVPDSRSDVGNPMGASERTCGNTRPKSSA